MKEKYKDNELESLKKGIEEGWLFNDEDENEYDLEESELLENKESVFEKYKKD